MIIKNFISIQDRRCADKHGNEATFPTDVSSLNIYSVSSIVHKLCGDIHWSDLDYGYGTTESGITYSLCCRSAKHLEERCHLHTGTVGSRAQPARRKTVFQFARRE